jgi:hypothetical protein
VREEILLYDDLGNDGVKYEDFGKDRNEKANDFDNNGDVFEEKHGGK